MEREEREEEREREREQLSNKNNFIIDGCRDVFAYLGYHPSGSLLIPLRMGRLVALCSTYTVATLFECLCAHFAQYVFDRSTLETGTESAQDRSIPLLARFGFQPTDHTLGSPQLDNLYCVACWCATVLCAPYCYFRHPSSQVI